MKKQKNEGITLIALVITIIVLLILAGVSIAMLTGDNGILTQANKSKEETTLSEQEEKRKLKEQEAYMEEFNADVELTKEEAEKQWELKENNGAIEIYKYKGNDSVVYIPSKIDGFNVVLRKSTWAENLSKGPFEKNKKITKIIVSGNVTLNSTYIFANIENLETLILKEGITKIPFESFAGCERLEYLALPSTLTEIEEGAFRYSGIRNIVIPKNVSKVGREIFWHCYNDITVHCEIEFKPEGWDSEWDKTITDTQPDLDNRYGHIRSVDWGYKNN